MTEWYLGQILTVGWNFAAVGTAKCNGQAMAISQNSALYQVIGTTYGGNGQTTFAVPNLQGRRMNHQGQILGGGSYAIGQAAGVTTATLTPNTMASHGHPNGSVINASTVTATDVAPTAGAVLGNATDISGHSPPAKPAIYCPSGTATTIPLAGLNVATTTGSVGGGQPFSILDPYLVINMLIALFGVFPSQG